MITRIILQQGDKEIYRDYNLEKCDGEKRAWIIDDMLETLEDDSTIDDEEENCCSICGDDCEGDGIVLCKECEEQEVFGMKFG